MYAHPSLHPREIRRRHRLAAKAAPPRSELPTPPDVARPRRTLDEKLDQALELTFGERRIRDRLIALSVRTCLTPIKGPPRKRASL